MGADHMISGGGRISEKKYPTNRIGTTTTTTTKVRCMFTPQNFKKNNLAKTNPPPLKIKWTTLGTEIAKSRLVVVTLKEKQKPRKQELKLSRTPSLKQVYNTVVIYTPTHICIPVHINNLQSNYWLVTVPLSKAICLLTSAVLISLTSLVCGQNSLHFHSLIVHENFFSTDVHW